MTREDVVTQQDRATALAAAPRTNMPTTAAMGVVRSAVAWAPLLALGVFLWFAGQEGLPRVAALKALLAIVLTQVAPGLLVWRAVRPRHGWWFEDITMGLALGLVLAVATQAAAGLLGAAWLSIVVGPAVAVALLVAPATRRRAWSARSTPLPWGWGPAVTLSTLLLLPAANAFYRVVPLEYPGFMAPYPDMPFHLSLVAELARRGPVSFPYVAGEPLAYHWFSHAWVAQIGQASGVELDVVLYRFVPGIVSVALVAIIAIAATRLSNRPWAGPWAALLAVAAGTLSVARFTPPLGLVKHLSPSLAVASLLMVALLVVLGCRWAGGLGRAGAALVVVLAIASSGTKGSALPVVVCGVALATMVAWSRRWPVRRMLTVDLGLLVASLAASLVLLFDGSTQQLRLDPVATLERATPVKFLLADTAGHGLLTTGTALVLLICGVLAIGAGLVAALVLRPVRDDPVAPLLLGSGLAGAAAFALMFHEGGSHSYFLRGAVPALAMASGYGVVALWGHLEGRRLRVAAATLAVVGTWLVLMRLLLNSPAVGGLSPLTRAGLGAIALTVVLVAGGLASRARLPSADRLPVAAATAGLALCLISILPVLPSIIGDDLPDEATIIPPDRPQAFSGDQIEAARWLRDHSERSDLVATNRHCANPRVESCDSRRFFVAAYTERQVLVEGWAYTPRAIARDTAHDDRSHAYHAFWNPDLLELNDGFLLDPSAEEARRLWDRGVRWLFIDRVVAHADGFGELAHLRYETPYARVYELATPANPGDRT